MMAAVASQNAAAASWRDAPFRPVDFLPVDLDVRRDPDGTIRIASRIAPLDPPANLARAFLDVAARQGNTAALVRRDADGVWQATSYAALARQVRGAAQWMIDTLPPGSVVAILSENTPAAAAMTLGCWAAGMVACPISPGFAMAGAPFARLRHVLERVVPAAIYVEARPAFAQAVEACVPPGTCLVSDAVDAFDRPLREARAIFATEPGPAVEAAMATQDAEAIACLMMTSGSTGLPKVVEQSARALGVTAQMGLQMLNGDGEFAGTLLDWMPWHHAAGASMVRTALLAGGTLHIDDGKPVPGLFAASIANLRDIPVRSFGTVPAGYAMLVAAFDGDPALRRTFFAEMQLMLYGGAGLSQDVLDRLQAHAVAETGHRIHMTTGYGMTETISGCMSIHFPTEQVGIGLPSPGVTLKLVPHGDRYEVRLHGAHLMSGYRGDPDATATAFDDEHFYRTGDTAVLHDTADIGRGLAFAGRLSDEFKLASGSWVYGSALRERLLAALAPWVRELVLADDGRPYLTLLAWPRADVGPAAADRVAEALRACNAEAGGSASRIRRFVLLDTPPSAAAQELTDKGTINRRAVIVHRAALVTELYADPPAPSIRVVGTAEGNIR